MADFECKECGETFTTTEISDVAYIPKCTHCGAVPEEYERLADIAEARQACNKIETELQSILDIIDKMPSRLQHEPPESLESEFELKPSTELLRVTARELEQIAHFAAEIDKKISDD